VPETCARVTIPGDPEAIHAAARALEREADRAEQEILEQIRRARDLALAGWSGTAAEGFDGWTSVALSFEAEVIDTWRAAAQILHTYAEELRAAQRALEHATDAEQSAEDERDSAEEDSRAESAAKDALRDAREDGLEAGKDAAAAAERASVAVERVIGGMPKAPPAPAPPAAPAPDLLKPYDGMDPFALSLTAGSKAIDALSGSNKGAERAIERLRKRRGVTPASTGGRAPNPRGFGCSVRPGARRRRSAASPGRSVRSVRSSTSPPTGHRAVAGESRPVGPRYRVRAPSAEVPSRVPRAER